MCRCVGTSEALDLFGREADALTDGLRGVLPDAFDERLVAHRVPRDVVVIDQIVANHHVHHGERERGVAARSDLQMPIGGFGRACADRIDDDHRGPAFPRFSDQRPEVEVGDDRVGAPQHDEAAVDDVLWVNAGAGADGRRESGRCDRTADVSLERAAAHDAEEAHVERCHLDDALHTGRAVRQDGLGARLGDNAAPPRGDIRQRFVPGHALEAALAFRADTLQREQDTVRVVDAIEVVVDLRAERSSRERMVGIPAQGVRPVAADVHHPTTGVGTVVAARASHLPDRRAAHGCPPALAAASAAFTVRRLSWSFVTFGAYIMALWTRAVERQKRQSSSKSRQRRRAGRVTLPSS